MPSAPSSASIKSQFSASAPSYAVSTVHALGPDLPLVVEAAQLKPSDRVVDLGCGAGHTAFALAPHCASVAAVDLTAEMLAVAAGLAKERGLSNVTFHEADVSRLPFADGSFEVAACRYCAHHFDDPGQALSEAARVLITGGRFVLVDTVAPETPALDTFVQVFEFLRDISHVRDMRASEWIRLLGVHGFSAEVRHRAPIVLDGADWVKRMQTPASKVAMIRELFAEASPAQKAAFDLRTEEPWGLSLPMALIVGVKN